MIESGKTTARISNFVSSWAAYVALPPTVYLPVVTSTFNNSPSINIAKSQGQEGLNALNTLYPLDKRSIDTFNSEIAPVVALGKLLGGLSSRRSMLLKRFSHLVLQNLRGLPISKFTIGLLQVTQLVITYLPFNYNTCSKKNTPIGK